MMNALIALGLGIIIFALIIGVGVVVLTNFGNAIASCASGYTFNTSTRVCTNNTAPTTDNTTAGGATTTTGTLSGYLQTNLTSWVPAIIALGVGLLFIGALMGRKSKTY